MNKRYEFQPNTADIPTNPGVYRYFDANKNIIYVGKAKNLRNRLTSYFTSPDRLHPRTKKMLETAKYLEWTIVNSDLEALQLEYTWIKSFTPKFNVEFKDDKSYVYLAISVQELYPRIFIYRGPKRKNIKYFGPYVHVWEVRQSLDQLLKIYPVRSCTKATFKRHKALGRPCLLGYIDKCSAPCVERISAVEHRENIKRIISFLRGDTTILLSELENSMRKASEELSFEKAAKIRDKLSALTGLIEKQTVVLSAETEADFFGFYTDELMNAAAQIFKVRKGKILGQEGILFTRNLINTDDSEHLHPEEIVDFIVQYYSNQIKQENSLDKSDQDTKVLPKVIYIPTPLKDTSILQSTLATFSDTKPRIAVPKLGAKKDLMNTVVKNAAQSLLRYKTAKATDIVARTDSLRELSEFLELPRIPIRIECTDISHLNGTNVVGSLVSFVDGLPKKNLYKNYNIKYAAGDGYSNDVASIQEIVQRRFQKEEDSFPDLFIVDGGAPQVNAAYDIFTSLEIKNVSLIGLAKRMEEVWLPYNPNPVILPRNSEALFLLQRIRDEAHNFAIRQQRRKRLKNLVNSELDRVPGLGEEKRKILLQHFGSLDKIKEATLVELQEVPGVGPILAKSICDILNGV